MTKREIRIKSREEWLNAFPKHITQTHNKRVEKLHKAIRKREISYNMVGGWLGITQEAARMKLTNESDFKVVEMLMIENMLRVDE